jgi:putative flippase GtrA
MRFISREFFRFIFWGGINTLAGYLVYVLLLQFLPYLVAYSISFLLSIFVAYFLNSRFVFKQELKLRKAAKYPLVYLTQYLLGTMLLYTLVHLLHVNKLFAPVIIVLVTIPVTYTLNRKIIGARIEEQSSHVDVL